MDQEIFMVFAAELGYGILATLPLYVAAYFSSSYLLFNSPHGSISEWEKISKELSMVVNSSMVSVNPVGDNAKIREIISDGTRPQVVKLSKCVELISCAEKRLARYKEYGRFIVFGIILSLSLSLINAIPIMLTGAPLVHNPWAYSGAITVMFGLLFVVCFNWTQSIQWNEFKEAIEANKKLMAKNGFV
jgi:hypothetical protein